MLICYSIMFMEFCIKVFFKNVSWHLRGGGKSASRFGADLIKLWLSWQPLTFNGENGVSTFSQSFLIRSFSNLQVPRKGLKSQDKFEFRPYWTIDNSLWSYSLLSAEKISYRLIIEKLMSPC